MVLHRWLLEFPVEVRGSLRLFPRPCYLQINQKVRTETIEWVGISMSQSTVSTPIRQESLGTTDTARAYGQLIYMQQKELT